MLLYFKIFKQNISKFLALKNMMNIFLGYEALKVGTKFGS